MNLEAFVRAAAFTMLAGTLLATAMTVSHREGAATQAARADTPFAPSNSLDAELARCSRLSPNGAPDLGCKAAWAESRKRFFASGRRRDDAPIDPVPRPRDSAPAPTPGEPPKDTPGPSTTSSTDPTFGQQAN